MAILFGLLSACCYGTSDFIGGLVTRRAHAVVVALLGQCVGIPVTALALAIDGGRPSLHAVGWGALSGVGAGLGTAVLYRGLAHGRMSVVAPLSGLGAAAIPVVVGVALGDRVGPTALVGILVALPAVVLVSLHPSGAGAVVRSRAGVPEGVGSGAAFALTFVGLARAGSDSGLWPTFVGALSAAFVLAIGCAAGRLAVRLPAGAWPGVVVFGILGALATISFLLAVARGTLTVVAVLSALYPALTVLCARVVLRERWGRLQVVGLIGAVAAAVLIAVG